MPDADSIASPAPQNPAEGSPMPWAWLAGAVLLLLAALSLTYWSHINYDSDGQRELAGTTTVLGMHACLVFGFAGLASSAPLIVNRLGRRSLLVALFLVLFGWLVCGVSPKTNRIYFDEHIYMQIGQTIAHTGKAAYAHYARAEYGQFELYNGWVNKQPNGHPYAISWAFRLFGVSENVAHHLNRLCAGFSACFLYLALNLAPLRLPRGAPLAAALLLIATPLTPFWCATVAVEPTAMTALIFTLLAACAHAAFRNPENGRGRVDTAAWLAAAAAFSCYFRPESVHIYLVSAAVLWITDRRTLRDPVTWIALAYSIALVTPNLLHLWSVRTEDWGATDGRRFDVDFIFKNLGSNGGYFFTQRFFPIAGTVFALGGLGWLYLRERLGLWIFSLWFLASWGIFILFYAGGYYYGASSRYALISIPAVATLMGVGLIGLWRLLRDWPAFRYALIAFAFLSWIHASRFVPVIGRESAEARADLDFVEKVAPTIPEGSLILASNPSFWQLRSISSAQFFTLDQMLRRELPELRRQYPGGIYAHWNFWHNAENNHAAYALDLIRACHGELVARYDSQEYHYGLFRLDTEAAISSQGGPLPSQRHGGNMLDALKPFDAKPFQRTPVAPPPSNR